MTDKKVYMHVVSTLVAKTNQSNLGENTMKNGHLWYSRTQAGHVFHDNIPVKKGILTNDEIVFYTEMTEEKKKPLEDSIYIGYGKWSE